MRVVLWIVVPFRGGGMDELMSMSMNMNMIPLD